MCDDKSIIYTEKSICELNSELPQNCIEGHLIEGLWVCERCHQGFYLALSTNQCLSGLFDCLVYAHSSIPLTNGIFPQCLICKKNTFLIEQQCINEQVLNYTTDSDDCLQRLSGHCVLCKKENDYSIQFKSEAEWDCRKKSLYSSQLNCAVINYELVDGVEQLSCILCESGYYLSLNDNICIDCLSQDCSFYDVSGELKVKVESSSGCLLTKDNNCL